MATGAKGEIYAAWRHVFTGDMRDIAFTASRDGGRTFEPLVRVHEDKWVINGCPDDGPAMAVEAAGTIHLVWPTVPNGVQGTLHYASSKDGRTFTAAVRVPTLGTPKPSHPQIAIDTRSRSVWRHAMHVAHNLAAAAWLGTLGVITIAAWRSRHRSSVERLVRKFSPIALTSAGVVFVSGVIAAWLYIGSWSSLWSTAYGRVLLAKLTGVAIILACGGGNWREVRRGRAPRRLVMAMEWLAALLEQAMRFA